MALSHLPPDEGPPVTFVRVPDPGAHVFCVRLCGHVWTCMSMCSYVRWARLRPLPPPPRGECLPLLLALMLPRGLCMSSLVVLLRHEYIETPESETMRKVLQIRNAHRVKAGDSCTLKLLPDGERTETPRSRYLSRVPESILLAA